MKNTKLKENIVEKLQEQPMTLQLALMLKCSQRSIQNHLDENKAYGRLTHLDALEAVSELLGIGILELLESEAAATAA
ncbi:MAG: hypothetical protein ACTHMM_05645 [Agriterribacter sp.]